MSEVQPTVDSAAEGGVGLDGPIIVVTAVHLSRRAREALAERLGPGHIVRDIREAGNTADIVLVPAMSSQGIGGLRTMFPGAKILAGEFVDAEYGVDIMGPMRRTVEAGVDGYFMAPDLAGVAQVTLDAARGRPVGILGAGSASARTQLSPPPSRPQQGTLHVVSPDHVLHLATAIGAVPLDEQVWAAHLGLEGAEHRERRTSLMWWVALQFLVRGIDVVGAVREWKDLAYEVGVQAVYDDT